MNRLRTLREGDWRVIDGAFVGALVLGALLNVAAVEANGDGEGPLAVNLILYAAYAGALWWRRTHPVAATAAVLAAGAIGVVAFIPPPDLTIAIVVLAIASYSIGAHAESRPAAGGLAMTVAGVTAIAVAYDPGDVLFPVGLFVIVPWLAGRVTRSQTMITRELAEKAERAEVERERAAAVAAGEERRRVARELHDVLAHDLSVMVVQAGAARRILEAEPERAVEAARLIERAGREALAELRHLFGPVHRGEVEALDGAPGVDQLSRLVERARASGVAITLDVEGERPRLAPGIDLAIYRVAQEAITNLLKHAGATSATVTLTFARSEVTLEVADDGTGPNGTLAELGSGGHGLLGMSERVALYGGSLEAGRRRGGGFIVRARLPLERAAVTA